MEWQIDDSLDCYELVREVEDEFGVKISDWEQVYTVDDLYRRTLAGLTDARNGEVAEDDVWRRLHKLLVRQLDLRPEQVVPTARFYIDLRM
jgi:hypothetical protein